MEPATCHNNSNILLKRFSAHVEVGTCKASLVPPKQSVSRIGMRSSDADKRQSRTATACHALQNVWPWLYSDVEDRRLFTALQSQLRFITKFIDNGSAAMYRLESELLAAACTDPSSHMENQLVLPLLRDRINAAADDLSKAQAENQDANRVRLCAALAINRL